MARTKGRPAVTFVVRLWLEDEEGCSIWRGQVEHLQTGEKAYVQDSDSGVSAYLATGSNGILSNGTKSFVQSDPRDPSRAIIYAALEGGEAGTYYRGSAQLVDGNAVITLPEHFGLVTEEEGLTVQVTPRGDCNGLYVAEVSTSHIVVRELQGGRSSVRFDFFINGVRLGYEDFQVLRPVDEVRPPSAHDVDLRGSQ